MYFFVFFNEVGEYVINLISFFRYAESDGDVIIKELKIQNVNFEVRHLNVGDFLWICRDANKKELVLPYIVERKRMDDCAKSITDGRFHEQKVRLCTNKPFMKNLIGKRNQFSRLN